MRHRATFEFAVVSVAAALWTKGRGRVVEDVRPAFGGVGTRPWRDVRVEAALRGAAGIRLKGRTGTPGLHQPAHGTEAGARPTAVS
ncbi:hypothetical protein ACQP1W_32645 [Spirillospora sp. CA-255316]